MFIAGTSPCHYRKMTDICICSCSFSHSKLWHCALYFWWCTPKLTYYFRSSSFFFYVKKHTQLSACLKLRFPKNREHRRMLRHSFRLWFFGLCDTHSESCSSYYFLFPNAQHASNELEAIWPKKYVFCVIHSELVYIYLLQLHAVVYVSFWKTYNANMNVLSVEIWPSHLCGCPQIPPITHSKSAHSSIYC